MDGSMLAATLTAWGMLVRCGEVAAMPEAFGWMGGWRKGERSRMKKRQLIHRQQTINLLSTQCTTLASICHVILLF